MKKKKILFILSVICGLCLTFTACNSNTQPQNQTTKHLSSSAAQIANDDDANLSQTQPAAVDSSKSSNSNVSQSNSYSNNDVYTFEYHDNTMPFNDMISAYEAPADIIKIDESEADPSNKNILFEYDDLGKIIRCSYTVNDVDFFQGYTYSDKEVEIFSYCGSTIVDDVVFSYTYDANIGFTESNGYYFNNIKVN